MKDTKNKRIDELRAKLAHLDPIDNALEWKHYMCELEAERNAHRLIEAFDELSSLRTLEERYGSSPRLRGHINNLKSRIITHSYSKPLTLLPMDRLDPKLKFLDRRLGVMCQLNRPAQIEYTLDMLSAIRDLTPDEIELLNYVKVLAR